MELDDAEGSSSTPREQWWKLGYVDEDDDQIKAEMKTLEQVMEEVCGVGSKPFLIYASEKAMGEAPTSLSEALQSFVRFDSKLFQRELSQLPAQDKDNDKKRGPYATPASPSKRRNRSNSWDSVDTNAASVGSLDVNGARDDDFFSVNDEPGNSEDMPDLIDFSAPDGPPPQRVASPDNIDDNRPRTIGSSPDQQQDRQATTVSLNEIVSRGLAERGERPPVPPRPTKSLPPRHTGSPPPVVEHYEYGSPTKSPEMEERGGTISPFFNNKNNTTATKVGAGGTGADSMDIDDVSSPTTGQHDIDTRLPEPEKKG
jgi:hypothetical protein